MYLRYPRHNPIYVRFTPAFVLAVAIGVAVVVCNAVIVGAGASWLYVAGDVRRDRERTQETDRRIEDMIKGIRG